MTEDVQRPAEATLYDDPATADLAAKVSEAWAEFAQALDCTAILAHYSAGQQ